MVLKRLFTAIGVTAAALALSLTATTSAAAAPADAPTPVKSRIESAAVPDTAVEQRTCRARFSQGVNQRLKADATSTILGIIPADTWVQASCTRVAGGEYNACGLASDFWMEVYWNGNWGHSVWSCVKDWEYTS
ncbi:hypothetical protein [Glycomyces paridis]|uniref:SH3 domain-containing protein n=1 Tax=Glycomyces paridis TaxID=2126555 RepID=A0A4S8PQ79_9ACTN|nr:hypothetical protein [Glycomyces paridis]THV32251.1 hypothetical protein E9998_02090 [Glycomyces paridis]